ncbi:MAG: glycosyltransferase family 4 protein [Solobacterium sp.]|nr:glycosyltransferase family 4 protein [Solobacterium sp.]
MNNRIVMLNNIPSPYCVDLFRALQKNLPEYEFHFIFTSIGEGNRSWKADTEGLNHAEVLKSRVLRLKTRYDERYIHFPGSIGTLLDAIDPAIVAAKEYNPSALQSLAWCRRHHRRYVHITEGTLHSERNLNPIQLLSRKLIISSADFCLAASTRAKEKLLYWKCPEEKIKIAYLTFDLSKMKHIPEDPVPGRILYVGSMAERKGLDLLIRSLRHLPASWSLHIAGTGSEEELIALKALAGQCGIHDRIQFSGYLEGEKLEREYAEASLFVLPTREDCFGLVLLEAAVKGIPIVASKYADGAYDVVEPGITGLLEDPYEAKRFAGAMKQVLEDSQFAANAKAQDLSRFSLEEVCGVYKEVFRALTL